MSYSKLIAFDRPLAGATLPGAPERMFKEADVAAAVEAAYRRGVDSAHAVSDQKMVEFRVDMEQLSEGILQRLAEIEPRLFTQLREALPGLAIDIAHRLLAGYQPPPETVDRLCAEALEQLFPEREGLELSLCPRDAELLSALHPGWLDRFPGLRIRADANLTPGDCLVRSRFGLTDARQETKLATLAHSLTGS
ncbi:MAG: FliH/SctL family protein [Opitutales bacterium]